MCRALPGEEAARPSNVCCPPSKSPSVGTNDKSLDHDRPEGPALGREPEPHRASSGSPMRPLDGALKLPSPSQPQPGLGG